MRRILRRSAALSIQHHWTGSPTLEELIHAEDMAIEGREMQWILPLIIWYALRFIQTIKRKNVHQYGNSSTFTKNMYTYIIVYEKINFMALLDFDFDSIRLLWVTEEALSQKDFKYLGMA